MTLRLQTATTADVPEVLALERQAFGVDAWSEASVRGELTGPRRYAVLAREDERLVAFAVSALQGDVLDLQRVVVADDHRRRGLATELVAEVVREGVAARARRLMLEVSATNEAGVRFYAGRGLREIARRPGYYRDGSDALVMEMGLQSEDVL